jgi:hypothetical protein
MTAGLGVVGVCVVGVSAALRASTRTAATANEARAALPGDDIISDPTTIWNRGITIEASPSEVWPWLVQMGYGRAGFYVPEWVDRRPSLDGNERCCQDPGLAERGESRALLAQAKDEAQPATTPGSEQLARLDQV